MTRRVRLAAGGTCGGSAAAHFVRGPTRPQQPLVDPIFRPPQSRHGCRGDYPAVGGHSGDADHVPEAITMGRRTSGAVLGLGDLRGDIECGNLANEHVNRSGAFS